MFFPFLTFAEYLKKRYPFPVYKATIDAGFICPNMDGTKGMGGCTFCNNASFSPAFQTRADDILIQIEKNIERFSLRRKKIAKKNPRFIAYFQSFSGTYGPAHLLREWYITALEHPKIIGLSVGTRCDCLSEEVLDIFAQLATHNQEIWIELGVESTHNSTLNDINRGHSFEELVNAVERIHRIPNLKLCLHLIHGLPGEDISMMLESVKRVNHLKPDAVKFHHLEIVKDTVMAKQYKQGLIKILEKNAYFDILNQSLQYIDQNIIIQRMFSFSPSDMLIAPIWEYKNLHQEFLEYYTQHTHT